MRLNDWELEDYIRDKRPDLDTKYFNGEITLTQIRIITGIKDYHD